MLSKEMRDALTITEVTNEGSAVLAKAGVGEAQREASTLLSVALGRARAFLIAHPEYVLSNQEAERYRGMLGRRAAREPLQYITGRQEFWGLEFTVTPDVLIPRPETEILVEEAVRLLRTIETPRFADACAGSGCIAVSILHSVPASRGLATDISAPALNVAAENAQRHDVADRLELVEADLFESITGQFDLIASNPPYIPDRQIARLQPEVRDHEPRLALSGGGDGLDILKRLIESSPGLLRPGGTLLIEIGFDQAERVRGLLSASEWQTVEFLQDLQGIRRIAKAVWS